VIQIEFLSVREPRWSREDRRAIDCFVTTNHMIGEHPFTASMDDCEALGRELYERCVTGEFDEIAPMESGIVEGVPVNIEMPPEYKILDKFFIEVNQENGRKSFRSVVIVWGSILDNLLDGLIESDVSRARASGEKSPAPPRTFGARIRLSKERGLIDGADAEKCQHIRRVRNAAAHEWQLSLESKDVLPSLRALYEADHSQFFRYHEDFGFLVQQIYAGSCVMLAVRFARSLQGPKPWAG